MAKLKVQIPDSNTITLSAAAADRLMDKGASDAALLYIYILSHSDEIDVEAAARRLHFTTDRVLSAVDTLSEIGLIGKPSTPAIPERSDEIPEYSQTDVAEHIGRDGDFKLLVAFCEQKLGRLLSTVDLQVLLGIYSWLGLPVDVICLLITNCIDETKKKYGEGRRLFKMAPFHHHLEKCGWRETKVVTLFYVATALLCLVGFLGCKYMFL